MRWAVLLWVLGGLCSAYARAETLVVFGGDSFAPTTYLDQGKPAGSLVDILQKVSAKTGDVYEIHLFPWKRAFDHAQRGEGAIVGLSLTPQRQAAFDFSEPLMFNELQLVVRRGQEFNFHQLGDLQGRIVGGGSGVSYGAEVDAAIAKGLFVFVTDTDASARLQKLLLGNLDVAIVGHGMAGLDTLINSQPRLVARRAEFSVLPRPLVRDPLYLAAAKSLQKRALIERLNRALAELQRSGAVAPVRSAK